MNNLSKFLKIELNMIENVEDKIMFLYRKINSLKSMIIIYHVPFFSLYKPLLRKKIDIARGHY